ncbi:MAG: hypothetical protein ABI778_08130 [Ignavibacteriota bacterium]
MLTKLKLFSPDAEGGSPKSEPVKRLANRYGIPERDVEALLYGSRAPKSEPSGSDTKENTMAEDFRPNFTIEPPRQRGWSPVNVLSAIVGILGIMALAIILISVLNRHHFEHYGGMMPPPPHAMPMPEQPHPPVSEPASIPKDSSLGQRSDEVPPPAATNEIASRPAAKHRSSGRSSTGFTTSNSMEAQERLAEMRADGNNKAKIRGSSKNGVTIYTVK